MTTPTGAAASGRTQSIDSPAKEYVVKRDGERPLAFAGVCLASEKMTSFTQEEISAAVYRTVGGKYISTFNKEGVFDKAWEKFSESAAMFADEPPTELARNDNVCVNKAGVFDTLEQAAGWFRPGRLTDRIRKMLGIDEPIRID